MWWFLFPIAILLISALAEKGSKRSPAWIILSLLSFVLVYGLQYPQPQEESDRPVDWVILDPHQEWFQSDQVLIQQLHEKLTSSIDTQDSIRWVVQEEESWKERVYLSEQWKSFFGGQPEIVSKEWERLSVESILLPLSADRDIQLIVLAQKDETYFPAIPENTPVYWYPLENKDHKVFLQGIEVPEVVRSGRPFEMVGTVYSQSPQKETIQLINNGEKIEEWVLEENVGRKDLRVSIETVEPGLQSWELRWVSENSNAPQMKMKAYSWAKDPPKIWFAGGPIPLYTFLNDQGFETTRQNIPLDDNIDAVIVSNPVQNIQAINQYIENGGGVLFMARESFPGAIPATLQKNLPVLLKEMPQDGPSQETQNTNPSPQNNPPQPSPPPTEEIKNPRKEKREAGVVALMFVLDTSGSMAGKKIERAKEAALQAAKTLDADDFVGVVSFSHESQTIHSLSKVGDLQSFQASLEKLKAGGGTILFPAVNKGMDLLLSAPASIRHLIVLTDGETEDKNSSDAPYKDYLTALSLQGITTTAVGIEGGDYDTQFLARLASWGKGRWYPVSSDRIPQIFTLEANRIREIGEATNPLPNPEEEKPKEVKPPKEFIEPPKEKVPEAPKNKPPLRFTPILAQPHPVLEGVATEGFAALRGYRPSESILGASIPLRIEQTEDPLLGVRHVGQGKVAVWLSDAGDIWAKEWFQDERSGKLFSQLMEYLRRRDPEVGQPWSMEVQKGNVSVLVESESDQDPFPLLKKLFPRIDVTKKRHNLLRTFPFGAKEKVNFLKMECGCGR